MYDKFSYLFKLFIDNKFHLIDSVFFYIIDI